MVPMPYHYEETETTIDEIKAKCTGVYHVPTSEENQDSFPGQGRFQAVFKGYEQRKELFEKFLVLCEKARLVFAYSKSEGNMSGGFGCVNQDGTRSYFRTFYAFC